MIQHVTLAVFLTMSLATVARADLQTKTVDYSDTGTSLRGFLAWDDAREGRRPGVLVVHEWWGLNDYARRRAEQLAGMGYVAFAVDMYGAGKVTQHPEEAGAWAAQLSKNQQVWQRRASAGLEQLRQHPLVDKQRVAAIGYCFGGATVLHLAYSGADVAGVVSFHGSLPIPEANQRDQIQAKILICHGASDNFVPHDQIAAFQTAMNAAGADWHMVSYGGARHSFTNPGADTYGMDGIGYHADADRRSWQHMQSLFGELFGAGSSPP